MLETIGNRDIPIPNHIDIFHLKSEMEASDKTALECVMEVDEERTRLEAEAAELTKLGDAGSERYCLISCLQSQKKKTDTKCKTVSVFFENTVINLTIS